MWRWWLSPPLFQFGICNFSSDAKFHKNKDAYFHIKLPSLIVRPAALQRGYKSNNRVFIQSSCCNIYTYYSITPHCFNPGLNLPFLQILPTTAFLSSSEPTPWTHSPDCLPILLSISVFYYWTNHHRSAFFVPQFTFCISHIAIFTRTVLRVIKGNWYAD